MNQLLDPQIIRALEKLSDYIKETTGQPPTAAEIAAALTKYFVLKEIKDHILMLRQAEPE